MAEEIVTWEAPELEAVEKKRKINQTRGGEELWLVLRGERSGAVGGSVLMTDLWRRKENGDDGGESELEGEGEACP